jgi:hypothetical protein
MKKMYLLIVLLTGVFIGANAQKTPRFEAVASSDSIFLGHYFQLTLTLENAKGTRFSAPDFGPDVEVMAGPNTSSSISIVNGETTQKHSYIYLLRPTRTGPLLLPSASIETDAGTLKTTPLDLRVLPNDAGVPQPSVNRQSDIFRFDFGDHPFFDRFPNQPAPAEVPKKKRPVVKM